HQREVQYTGSEDEIDLFNVIGTLWRGKWTIILLAFLASLLGGYYAINGTTAKFSATARLAIQLRDQNVVDVESVVSSSSKNRAAINTELEIIRSRGLIEEVVRELNLTEDPEFNGHLREPSKFSTVSIRNFLADYLPIPKREKGPAPSLERATIAAANQLRSKVSVASQRDTYLINVLAKTEDPYKSADIVNTLARLHIEEQIATKFEATEFATNWLSERVIELELELKSKEDAIKDLRAETDLISLEALGALNARSKDMRERVSAAKISVANARIELSNLESLAQSKDIDAILAEVSDVTLNRLATAARSGDTNAELAFFKRFDLSLERSRLDATRQAAQLEALEDSFARIQAQVSVQSEDLVRLNQLMRESDATRVLYETFLTRLKETSVQIGLQQADTRILSPAIRGRQVEPRKARIVIMSFLIGSVIGVGIVMMRQFMHNGFRTAEDLEQATGYSVLGQTPRMPIRKRSALINYLHTKPTSAAAESIRNLRTSILLADVDNPPKVIMMTSSIPGEGKTTQAIALAGNLSGLGKKVLLIEGDIRRRTLNQYFDQSSDGDLIGVLSGKQDLEDAIIRDETLGVDVLMGGKTTINAADLFSSDKFKTFMRSARSAFDYVIIDTPPVLVVPDARVIADQSDVVIYAVKWDSTGKQLVIDGLRQFSSLGLQVDGLVLSQIDVRRMKSYGYGGKYGAYSTYGKGYYDV
ncbi:polysaccharide biosynthesis tyrosine autokinase, partial [Planktotalea sp.]|uniref:GumC family protein n=1 Tax=Planktotalea sp. TaxID=2029877 RepID=UPI00329A2CAB